MSGHPLHGTKPLVEKLTVRCDWKGDKNLFLWKLERTVRNKSLCREVHPTAGTFLDSAVLDAFGRPSEPGQAARTWARQFSGWHLVAA